MKYYLFVILAAIGLSFIGVFVKLLGDDIPIMTLNFYRIFIGFLFLLMICPLLDKSTFKPSRQDLKEYFVVGFVTACAVTLLQLAYFFSSIQEVVVLNYTFPFIVLFLSMLILGEKITSRKLYSMLIAFIGIIIMNPFSLGNLDSLYGNILALLSAIATATMVVVMRKEDKNHTIGSVVWYFFFASLLLSPSLFIYGLGDISNWPLILLFGFITIALTYTFLNIGMEKIEADMSSAIIMILTPLSAFLLAIFLIGEDFTIRAAIGGFFLILGGIFLNIHKKVPIFHIRR